jgi:hypothetical protein
MPRFENNPNWTPVQTYRLEDSYLPFFISASQYDLHGTEPMLEPFRHATTIEELSLAMQSKAPLPFTVMPMESGLPDTIVAIPHPSVLAELQDRDLSLAVSVGAGAANFAREAHQRGMKVTMFASIAEAQDGGEDCMLQAYNLIATGNRR